MFITNYTFTDLTYNLLQDHHFTIVMQLALAYRQSVISLSNHVATLTREHMAVLLERTFLMHPTHLDDISSLQSYQRQNLQQCRQLPLSVHHYQTPPYIDLLESIQGRYGVRL